MKFPSAARTSASYSFRNVGPVGMTTWLPYLLGIVQGEYIYEPKGCPTAPPWHPQAPDRSRPAPSPSPVTAQVCSARMESGFHAARIAHLAGCLSERAGANS